MSHLRIDVTRQVESANTDVLSGTSLDPIPEDGILSVYAAGSSDDGTISIDPAKHPNPTGAGTQMIPIRTGGEIRSYDPHWQTPVDLGEKVNIAFAGTLTLTKVWASFTARG